jgi:hypothetical protein
VWEYSRKFRHTHNLAQEEWAKKAYRIFKDDGKLPYPNGMVATANRFKYYGAADMAAKLGMSETYYRAIKPLVDILFEAEKSIKNELVIAAVQDRFDRKMAGGGPRKALPGPGEEVLEAEYQVAEV